MTWEGRNLKMVVSSAGSIFAYTYNDQGLRLSKLAYSHIYYYTWDGDTLVSQRWGNNLFVFLYDENGSPIGLQYRTSDMDEADFYTYFFEKNLQGDIIGLYDMDGYCVATYTYDAWGRCTSSMTGEGIYPCDDTVVQYNPFRYRGYYYDTETGLYYLQSRYYDPNTGRFLNADGYVNANGDLLGFNMYAYCGNNPVMYTDPSGEAIGLYSHLPGYRDPFLSTVSGLPSRVFGPFKNKDGSYSLHDNDRFEDVHPWHEQIFAIQASGPSFNLDFDSKEMDIGLGSLQADALTGGWEWEYADLSLFDFGHVEAAAEISEEGINVGAMASIWSPSFSITIGKVTVEIGAEIGSVGASLNKKTGKVSGAFSLFGIGASLAFSWD